MCLFNKSIAIHRELQNNLPILGEFGYKIFLTSSIQIGMTYWRVLFKSPTCFILVYQDRNEIYLHFAPLHSLIQNDKEFKLTDQISLYGIVYFLSQGEKIIGIYNEDFFKSKKPQYNLISKLLFTYHNQIIPYFSTSNFWSYRTEIIMAKKEYDNFIFNRYVIARHPREKFNIENIFIDKND